MDKYFYRETNISPYRPFDQRDIRSIEAVDTILPISIAALF